MKELIIGEVLIMYNSPEELCRKVNKLDYKTRKLFFEEVQREMRERGLDPYADDDEL